MVNAVIWWIFAFVLFFGCCRGRFSINQHHHVPQESSSEWRNDVVGEWKASGCAEYMAVTPVKGMTIPGSTCCYRPVCLCTFCVYFARFRTITKRPSRGDRMSHQKQHRRLMAHEVINSWQQCYTEFKTFVNSVFRLVLFNFVLFSKLYFSVLMWSTSQLHVLCNCVYLLEFITGLPRLLEGPGFFFCKIARSRKVLEILVQGPGKSWNFLGYDVGGGHNDAGADAKICEN